MGEGRPITVILGARNTEFYEQGAPISLVLWEICAPFLIVWAKDPLSKIARFNELGGLSPESNGRGTTFLISHRRETSLP